jgi:hypothetical protein
VAKRKASNAALLARLKRELAKPRLAKSVREHHAGAIPKVSKIEQFFQLASSYPDRMKKTRLVPKTVLTVPCPTCGVVAGKPCVLWLGDLRTEPHASRKVASFEALEMKKAARTYENRQGAFCSSPSVGHGD